MFWGSFSAAGPGLLFPVTGMMNDDRYIDVLRAKLLPHLRREFPNNEGVFQQDLAPCHTSKKVKKFMTDNGITVLEWPGNSPDLNPIENLSAIIKQKLRRCDCTTRTKMIEAILRIWFHDAEFALTCQKLVDSMPNRVNLLLKAKGGHISY